MRRINIKLLFILVVVVATLGFGGVAAYKIRRTRNIADLLVQAKAAEASGDRAKAAGLYYLYLGFQPDDTATMTDYALMLARDAKTSKERGKALEWLAQVIRRDSKRADVRREIIRIATDRTVQRHAQALEQIVTLLKSSPDDGELEFEAGRCEEAERNDSKAAEWYEKAIAHTPKRIDAYLRLAGVLDKPEEAEKVLDRMVESNPDSYRAYLERGNQRLARGLIQDAGKDIARALELAPDEIDVLAASANLAMNEGNVEKARTLANRCLKARENEGRFYDLAFRVEIRDGKPKAAEAILRQGIERITAPEARLPLLGVLASFQISNRDYAGASETIGKLSTDKANPTYLKYLEAEVLAGKEQWRDAAEALDQIHGELVKISDDLAFDADLLLAFCCERLGESDRRFVAMNRAAALKPRNTRARLGLAEALSASGRIEDSISQYQTIVGEIPIARLGLVRLLIARNLRRPPADRDWREVDRALADADSAFPNAMEIQLLRANSLDERGDLTGAARELRLAVTRFPESEQPAIALANHLALKERNPKAAIEILDQAEKTAKQDRIGLRMARANVWIAQGGPEAIEALNGLGETLDGFSEAERITLLRGLAEAHRQLGDPSGARRIVEALIKKSPYDLNLQIALFDIAFRAGDGSTMKAVLDAIGDKDEVLIKLANARYLAWSASTSGQAGRPNRALLDEARKILGRIATQRSGWLPAVLASAQVDDMAGRVDRAIQGYVEAVNLGERSPEIGLRLIGLLATRERYDRADEIVRKYLRDGATPKDPLFYRFAAEVALRVKDAPRALEYLAKVPRDPKSATDLLWRGRILWDAGKLPEAGRELRLAVDKAGETEAPDAWVTLVTYLVATKDPTEAEQTIERARRTLPERFKALTLARCFAAIGQAEKAREQYQSAVGASPGDVRTLATSTDVAIQIRSFNDAIDYLRQLARQADYAPELAARANKTLAVLLAMSRDRKFTAEALKLLNLNDEGTPFRPTADTSVEDLRSIAEVLTLKGGPRNRQVALECSQAIIDRGNPSRNDRFLIAQILEMSGEWSKASEQIQLALVEPDPPLVMLAFYVRGLLVHEKGEGAKPWFETLEKLDPSSASTTELKARLALAEGQPKKASRLILDYARANPETTFAFAQLLEKLGRIDDAEKLYRESAMADKRPEASLPLATFLGRQNRVKDALQICDQSWTSLRPELVAKTSVEILYASAAGEDDCQRVLDRIEAALRNAPKPDLKLSRVYVQMLREKYDDAEALFRELHEEDPRNSVWANNLAMVLTFQEGKSDKAIALIDEAIDVVGPIASLLDTRGIAKAAAGRQDAIEDFLKATSLEATAERFLHLAIGYDKANRSLDAKEALKKAVDLGLEPSKLQPRDRKEFGRLASKLEGS